VKVQDSVHPSALLVPSDKAEKGYQSDDENDENESVATGLLGKKEISNHDEKIAVTFVRIVKTRQIDESNIVFIQSEFMGLHTVCTGRQAMSDAIVRVAYEIDKLNGHQ
jgi:hypothetical protein